MHGYGNNKFFCFFWIIGILLTGFSGPAFSGQPNDVETFLNMLDSESAKPRIDAAKIITRSGLTDPVLFDAIKEKPLEGYTLNSLNRSHVDEMSWFCKALASSGNTIYTDTLREVAQNAPSNKLRNYAKKSIDQIPVHAKQNQLIQAGAGQNRDLTDTRSWMCKALGASGKSQYKTTLMEVIEKSHSEKLKKYARKSLGML